MKTYETENLIEVYNNLVASHEKGEFAACKYNLNNGTETIEFVFTTDDLPDNYAELSPVEVIEKMKIEAVKRRGKTLSEKGLTPEERLRAAYNADGEEEFVQGMKL